MRLGRPVPPIVLTIDERETLEQWARRRTTAQAIALRARLVLRCATGETATAIAREMRITKQTVGKWRARFVARRLDGLLDEPRPGVTRTITDAQVENVLTTSTTGAFSVAAQPISGATTFSSKGSTPSASASAV